MPRIRPPVFPELEKQILMRDVKKADIAKSLQISGHALSNKLTGKVEFTLREAEQKRAILNHRNNRKAR